jgi:glycosidase
MIMDCGKRDPIQDLIPFIRLQNGVAKTIDLRDLFIADQYDITFGSNPHIRIIPKSETYEVDLVPDTSFCGLTTIPFTFQGQAFVLPVYVEKLHSMRFSYRPVKPVTQVTLFGSFNSWNRQELFMTDPEGNGTYSIVVPLAPGRYEYKFYVDGKELFDRSNPDRVPNPFGDFNSLITVESSTDDCARLHTHHYAVSGEGLKLSFHLESPGGESGSDHIFALLDNHILDRQRIEIEDDRIHVMLPGSCTGILRIGATGNGWETPVQTVRIRNGEIAGLSTHPFFWQDAVIYAIMIDRFLDGDPSNTRRSDHPELHDKANFHGGDLQGILNKLEEGYFDSLGINTLWLYPVIRNTDKVFREYPPPHRFYAAYHGYWPVHHRQIDERFGDMALFKSLIETAHKHGLRVLLDYVSNHVHEDHPFFQEHPEWFGTLELEDGRKNIRFWDEYRLTTWFEPYLPSFDYINSPEALETMTDNAVWWVRQTGIDGFRQDAVKHVPHLFWRTLKRKLRTKIKRPLFQIGETFGSYDLISSYINNGQLDSQFNFNLYETALQTFLGEDGHFAHLDREMKKTFRVYGINHLMGNLMDSHDKTRYMALADGDLTLSNAMSVEVGFNDPPMVDHPESYQKALLYLVYMMTIPGTPVIYYGDEIGMSGAADPDNRRPMRFGDALTPLEQAHLPRFRKIVQLRSKHSSLRYGDFNTLMADENLYAYLRSDFHERILVVLNKSDSARRVTLDLPESITSHRALDCISSEQVYLDRNGITLTVDPVSWRILRL